jgi:tetratricopeptide (TPR) repeat protein
MPVNWVAFDSDKRILYANCDKDHSVYRIDLGSGKVVGKIKTDTPLAGMVLSSGGKWVFGLRAVGTQGIFRADIEGKECERTVSLGNGIKWSNMIIDKRGTHIFLANETNSRIAVVRARDSTAVGYFDVANHPHFLAASPTGDRLAVSNKDDHTVSFAARRIIRPVFAEAVLAPEEISKLNAFVRSGGADSLAAIEKYLADRQRFLDVEEADLLKEHLLSEIEKQRPGGGYSLWAYLRLNDTGRSERAEELLNAILEAEHQDVRILGRALRSRAERLYGLKDYKQVIDICARAAALKMDTGHTWYCWARALSATRQYEESLSKYAKAVEAGIDSREIWLAWGQTLYCMRKYREAARKYQRASEHTPTDASILMTVADNYRWAGDYEKALSALGEVARLVKDNKNTGVAIRPSSVHTSMGKALTAMGRFDEAVSECEVALKLNSRCYETGLCWGFALFMKGEYPDAAKIVRQSGQSRSKNPYYGVFNLGYVLAADKRKQEAVDNARNFLVKYGTASRPWQKALCEYFAGTLKEKELIAIALSKGGKKGYPKRAEMLCEGYFYVGMMKIAEGDAETGRGYLENCVETHVLRFVERDLASQWLANSKR